MTKRFVSRIIGGLLCLPLGTTMAAANSQRCAAHDILVERLADVYGEQRQAMGLARDNTVVEVYASDESGSWSITVTKPGGPTCLVAAGENFRLETVVKTDLDPDA